MKIICAICRRPYDGYVCTKCTVNSIDVTLLEASRGLHLTRPEKEELATAFLIDLVSTRKIPINTIRCQLGRDDHNDIVISGDQSISRFHFVITKEGNQYTVQDGNSRHGTFLNGNLIKAPAKIYDGDVLKAGFSLFWFVIENVIHDTKKLEPLPVKMASHM